MLSLYLSICFSEDGRIKVAYVYDNYRPFMIRVAYKYVHDMDLASDMVHDAIINLASCADELKIDNQKSLKTYLYTVAKNAAIDYLRKHTKATVVDFGSVENVYRDDTAPSALEVVMNDFGYNSIVDCIRSLPDTYKDVLYLRYVSEMKETDIATALGITYDNVAARIHRGKKLLKKMLEEQKNEK